MQTPGSANIAEVFISCKKEVHYSRQLVLPQPALVHILSGEMRIAAADGQYNFFAGETILIPRNQLGRMSKLPHNGQPCLAISIVFLREVLQNYYAANQIPPLALYKPELKALKSHPLLESLFTSLLPYFKIADALPPDIATLKIEEAIRVLRAIDTGVDNLLGQFDEPGKLDLVGFMEKN